MLFIYYVGYFGITYYSNQMTYHLLLKNHQTFLITFKPYKLSYSIGMHWSWFLVLGGAQACENEFDFAR